MTDSFVFSAANSKRAKKIIDIYPKGKQQSAVVPLLDLAQRQNDGWLSVPAMEYIAGMLGMSYIRVYEVASFYTMFHLHPMGKKIIHVCRTTSCWLRGSDKVLEVCKKKLFVEPGQTTSDGRFSLSEVECLGACVNAPVVQINDDYYENIDEQAMVKILNDLGCDDAVESRASEKLKFESS